MTSVLDRLDQKLERNARDTSTRADSDAIRVKAAHLRALLDVARSAQAHIDMEWAAFAEYGEPEEGDTPPNTSVTHSRLVAALAPLLEDTE